MANTVQFLTGCLHRIHFNILPFIPTCNVWFFPQFKADILQIFHMLRESYMASSVNHSWFNHHNNIFLKITNPGGHSYVIISWLDFFLACAQIL